MATPTLQDVYKKLSDLTALIEQIASVLHITRHSVEDGKKVKEIVPNRNPLGKGSSRKT